MKLTSYSFLVALSALLRIMIATYAVEKNANSYGEFYIQVSSILFLFSIFDGLRAEYYVSTKKIVGSKVTLNIIRVFALLLTIVLAYENLIFCLTLVLLFSFNTGLLANKLAEQSKRKSMLKLKIFEITFLFCGVALMFSDISWALLTTILASSLATKIMLRFSPINDIEVENVNWLKISHFWSLIAKSFTKYMDVYIVNFFQPDILPVFKYIKSLSNFPNLLSTLLTDYYRSRVALDFKWIIFFFTLHASAGIVAWTLLHAIDNSFLQFHFLSYKNVILLYFLLFGLIGYSRVLFLKFRHRILLITPWVYIIVLVTVLMYSDVNSYYVHLISQSSSLLLIIVYGFSRNKSVCRKTITP